MVSPFDVIGSLFHSLNHDEALLFFLASNTVTLFLNALNTDVLPNSLCVNQSQ